MKIGIKGKFILFLTIIWIGIFVVFSFYQYKQRISQLQRRAIASSEMLVKQITADREYYTSRVVKRAMAAGMEISESYHEMTNAIPLPATFVREVSEQTEKGEGYSVKLISLYPINKLKGPKDEFEKDALEFVSKKPNDKYIRFEDYDSKFSIRYMAPDIAIDETCVNCHNNHPLSSKKDYKIGDVMGGLKVTLPLEHEKAIAIADMWKSIGYGFIIFFGVGVVGIIFINKMIISPILQIKELTKKLAKGVEKREQNSR